MNTKKVVSLGDGEDPLSTSSTPFIKKVAPKNVFERVIQEQEKDLLGGHSDKKHGFVVNKNTQVHMGAKDVAGVQSNKVVTNPFKQSAKVLAASQPEPIQPREVIFPSQNQIQNQSKKQTEREPSPSRKPFDNPKVQAVLKTVEEKEKVSPPKPKPVAPQKDAIKLTNVDLVPGEKPLVSVSCFISLMQYPHLSTDGVLIITNYQVIFRPSDEAYFNKKPKLKKDYLNVPLSFVFKFDKATDKKNPDVVYIDLHSKDGRVFRLRLAERHGLEIMQYLHVYAFPERKDHFFAVEYGRANKELEDRFKGWQIYDIEKEFKRQGCEFALSSEPDSGANQTFRIIENKDFRICSTYPPKLLVPAKISDSAFYASSRFRTKERVPAVTYYYAKTKAILSRSSQSKPGLYQSRCLEDEQLLRYLGNPHLNDIGDTGVTDVNLYIYDARPYLNAMANRVNGKGFEDTKWYRNCEIFFMDIDNIHHVRDSHRKLLNLCHSPDLSNLKWYSQLESSNWLELMSYIIGAAIKVASSLRNGKNCLVHCSDGWDRTAQILSLAQIMLDPYFRTIEGFEVLIMKDWVYFGHQFNMRMGHGNKNEKDDQKAPVFLQFLDCIHQLIHQYPFAFEFNQKFLTDLAYHAYSCKFGLFLCNSYKEVVEHRMEEKTVSIWSYLNAQKEKYFNIYYNKGENLSSPLILKPSHHLKHLRLWEEHFLNYSWLSKPQYELMESIAFPTDFFEHMLMKDRKKVRELKAEVDELKAKLKQYERKASKDEGNGSPNSEAKINEGEERITRDTKQEEEKQENEVVKQKKKKDKWQYKEGPAPELTHSETIQTFGNDQIPREENGNQGDLNAELVRDPEVQETSTAEQKEENDEDRVSGEDDAKNESADQKIQEGEQKEVQVEGKEAPEEHQEVNEKQEQKTGSINAISEQKEEQPEESKVPEETKVIEEAQGEKANLEEEKKEIKDLQNEMNVGPGTENPIIENIVKEEQASNNEGNPEQESRECVDL